MFTALWVVKKTVVSETQTQETDHNTSPCKGTIAKGAQLFLMEYAPGLLDNLAQLYGPLVVCLDLSAKGLAERPLRDLVRLEYAEIPRTKPDQLSLIRTLPPAHRTCLGRAISISRGATLTVTGKNQY